MNSKVYILIDDHGRIIAIDGGVTVENVNMDAWILIDEGYGDRYALCQSHYLDKPLTADDGSHNYIWNGSVREVTEEERSEEIRNFPIPEPSEMDRLESQIMWTALMTDTLL